ncbi:MAG: MraY family glycosyltransferase [Candidatus Omnitrophota bacterium]
MYKYYILIFLISLVISYVLTPVMRRLSIKNNWTDKPNYRKINKKPMPLLGGVALFSGFTIAIAAFMFRDAFRDDFIKIVGFLGGAFIIVLVGIEDDLRGMTARRKLFYQIAAASIAAASGFIVINVSHPLGHTFQAPFILSIGLTILWIVSFTNAINLLDGMDGLASGVSAIIAASLFAAAVKSGNAFVAMLSAGLIGSSLGFLPKNFYPAKIFMGDTGSMFLGYSIALISLEGAHKGSTLITLLIPVIAMGVPIVDTLLSILRRLVKGAAVFKPDKEHIHHKLLFLGKSQREVVIRLYFLTACFGMIAISLAGMRGVWVLLALIATAILALRWVVNSGFLDFAEEDLGENK